MLARVAPSREAKYLWWCLPYSWFVPSVGRQETVQCSQEHPVVMLQVGQSTWIELPSPIKCRECEQWCSLASLARVPTAARWHCDFPTISILICSEIIHLTLSCLVWRVALFVYLSLLMGGGEFNLLCCLHLGPERTYGVPGPCALCFIFIVLAPLCLVNPHPRIFPFPPIDF